MKTIINPDRKDWGRILQRPVIDQTVLFDKVRAILQDVKQNGDSAVNKYTLEFDHAVVDKVEVTGAELSNAQQSLSPALKKAIEIAAKNIKHFHKRQLTQPEIIETMPGVKCWRRSVAIEKVGLYIPGGTAPLFSTVLMLGIPAMLAGCKEIIVTSPPTPSREKDGAKIHPAILFAAQLVGITKIFKVGGVQAIAAMAYGTKTIPAVHKIFGPGNQYVNCAKQWVQFDGLAIDMPAGPSEVCVLADESCDPSFVAADLLSQAEHGSDSQVLLICNSETIVEKVLLEIGKQLDLLQRNQVIEKVLKSSNAVVLTDTDKAIDMVNEYAPEHLIIARKDAEQIAEKVVNAGSVFIGNYSPESAGDYASGTNHVLPTNGYAKSFSGVSIDSFVKKITYQQISEQGLFRIADTVQEMAAAEGLDAHKNSISIRLK